jgi:hypothetical protein
MKKREHKYQEVMMMCLSNDFVEQQANEYAQKIRKGTIYKFSRVEENDYSFITKVILEDEAGLSYSVEPNSFGLRFAKGEITYKEYKRLQERETFNGITSFIVIIGFVSILMITTVRFLI